MITCIHFLTIRLITVQMLVHGFHQIEQGDTEKRAGQFIGFRNATAGLVCPDTYQPRGFQLTQEFVKRLTTTFQILEISCFVRGNMT